MTRRSIRDSVAITLRPSSVLLLAILSLAILSSVAVVAVPAIGNRELPPDQVPGTYSLAQDELLQRVEISADGSYVNSLYRNGALVWREGERWTIDRDGYVTFGYFHFGLPQTSQVLGAWSVQPNHSLSGRKFLCFDPDLDRCFATE